MEQLVVRLGTTMSDPVHWVVWSTQDQDVIASGELPDASALASLTERTRLRRAFVSGRPATQSQSQNPECHSVYAGR